MSPWRPSERRTETLAELCDRAVAESLSCLEAIEHIALEGGDAGCAAAAIGDRDMIRGECCGDPRPPVAFAPDRDALWSGA